MTKTGDERPKGSLGKVIASHGGRSMKPTLIGGGVLAGVGLAGILYDVAVTRDAGPAGVVGGILVLLGVAYIGTNWSSIGRTVEVCKGGLRIIERGGMTEYAWDEIERVEVSRFRYNGRLHHNVVIHPSGAPPIELMHQFWQSVGGGDPGSSPSSSGMSRMSGMSRTSANQRRGRGSEPGRDGKSPGVRLGFGFFGLTCGCSGPAAADR